MILNFWPFHIHRWDVVKYSVTETSHGRYNACALLQCIGCLKRKYITRGVNDYPTMEDKFPSELGALIWISSWLSPDSKQDILDQNDPR